MVERTDPSAKVQSTQLQLLKSQQQQQVFRQHLHILIIKAVLGFFGWPMLKQHLLSMEKKFHTYICIEYNTGVAINVALFLVWAFSRCFSIVGSQMLTLLFITYIQNYFHKRRKKCLVFSVYRNYMVQKKCEFTTSKHLKIEFNFRLF